VFKLGKINYKSAFRNGIKSLSKGKSDLTLTFRVYKELSDIIIQPGSRVDVRNPVDNGWLPGQITQVVDKDAFIKILTIAIEGGMAPNMEIVFPNKNKIQPCGEFVKNRDCSQSRRNLNTSRPIKIRFAPREYNEPGEYLLDNGLPYGAAGKSFGWSKDISNRMRSFLTGSKDDLYTLALFAPSPKSKFCVEPNEESLCEIITWSVKTGGGTYYVRINIGDPQNDSQINLKINDAPVIVNDVIPRGELRVYEEIVEAKNEFLIFSPECDDDCDYAVTKINSIEITPFNENEEEKKEAKNLDEDLCGNGFKGGRCDIGPDIENCVFDDPHNPVVQSCNGQLMVMLIPNSYSCKDQIGKFKCIRKSYATTEECRKSCVRPCSKNLCVY